MTNVINPDIAQRLVPLPPINDGQRSINYGGNRDIFFNDLLNSRMEEQNIAPNYTSTVDWQRTNSFQTSSQSDSTENGVNQDLMAAAKMFEGYILSVLLSNMTKSLGGGGVFGDSFQSKIYQDMFYEELGKNIGDNGPGLGIAQVLYDDIMFKASLTAGALLDV